MRLLALNSRFAPVCSLEVSSCFRSPVWDSCLVGLSTCFSQSFNLWVSLAKKLEVWPFTPQIELFRKTEFLTNVVPSLSKAFLGTDDFNPQALIIKVSTGISETFGYAVGSPFLFLQILLFGVLGSANMKLCKSKLTPNSSRTGLLATKLVR